MLRLRKALFFTASMPLLSFALNVQQFSRSNSLVYEMLEDAHMENSHVYSDYGGIFTLGGSWVQKPFILENTSDSRMNQSPIPSMTAVHFGAGIYARPWLMFGLTSSFDSFKWRETDLNGAVVNSGSRNGFSDFEFSSKIRVINEDQYALAIMPTLTLPTRAGKFDPFYSAPYPASAFLSDNNIGLGTKVIFEYLLGYFQLVANVGYRYNSGAAYGPIDLRNALETGLGAYVPITESVGLNAEFSREWAVPIRNNVNPNEFYLGASGGLTQRLHAFAGIGLGNLFQNNDSNTFRVSAGIKYVPILWAEEKVPLTEVAYREEGQKQSQVQFLFGTTNVAVFRFSPDEASTQKVEGDPDFQAILFRIISNKDQIAHIQIEGHTSFVKNKDYGKKLSLDRAESFKKILVAHGIPDEIISTVGKGDAEPVDPGLSHEAFRNNRRVEFKVDLKATGT